MCAIGAPLGTVGCDPLHWWLAMDSNDPRRLYESRVLPTELASRFTAKVAGRAGFEPAHGVSNSHVPFSLATGQKHEGPDFVGAFENRI